MSEKSKAASRRHYHKHCERRKAGQRAYRGTPEGKAVVLLSEARRRTKQYNLPECTLEAAWLVEKIEHGCDVTGVKFEFGKTGKRGPRSPSLDQIEAGKGYTPDNCRVICWALNAAFGDWGMEEFERIWNERKPV